MCVCVSVAAALFESYGGRGSAECTSAKVRDAGRVLENWSSGREGGVYPLCRTRVGLASAGGQTTNTSHRHQTPAEDARLTLPPSRHHRRYHYLLPIRTLFPNHDANAVIRDEAEWEARTTQLKSVTRKFLGQGRWHNFYPGLVPHEGVAQLFVKQCAHYGQAVYDGVPYVCIAALGDSFLTTQMQGLIGLVRARYRCIRVWVRALTPCPNPNPGGSLNSHRAGACMYPRSMYIPWHSYFGPRQTWSLTTPT
jgi:hypothetical protein